jgi:hypothetical protein
MGNFFCFKIQKQGNLKSLYFVLVIVLSHVLKIENDGKYNNKAINEVDISFKHGVETRTFNTII